MEEMGFRIDNMNVHYFHYPLDAFVDRQRELGEKHLVFWASVPHIWADHYGLEPYEDLFGKILSAGLVVDAIVARPYNYSLFADRDSLLAAHSLAYYYRMIDLASKEDVPLLGIELWGALRDIDRSMQLDNCCKALGKLCAYAEEKRVKLAVGNVSYSYSAMMNTLPEVEQLVGKVTNDNLVVALDYGTAWLHGERVVRWMDAFGERLRIVYLSDARNDGGGYPLSMGCCPIRNDLRQLAGQRFAGIAALRMTKDFCREDPGKIDRLNRQYLAGDNN